MLNLRKIDLNLLTVFEVVYEERNQRKASERLFMTQPAVSASIARLRDIVNDKLFAATPKGLVATPKAVELYNAIHTALNIIRSNLDVEECFDPSECQRVFKLAVDYGSGAAIALPLFNRLRTEAPFAKLHIVNLPKSECVIDMMREGELDVVLSQYRLTDPFIESIPYNWHTGVIVVRKGHPRIHSAPSVEALAAEDFVFVHGQPTSYDVSNMDNLLACIRDRVVLEVPSATVIPSIIRRSDMVSLISKQVFESLENSHELQVFDLPVDYPPAATFVHWKQDLSHDPSGQWFKEQFNDVLNSMMKAKSDRKSHPQ